MQRIGKTSSPRPKNCQQHSAATWVWILLLSVLLIGPSGYSIYVCGRYERLLSESPLATVWNSVCTSGARRPDPSVQQEPNGNVLGIKINSRPSLRAQTKDKYGRGFQWKFSFFDNHNFESAAEALLWSRKYLRRQIEAKLSLGRDVSSIEKMFQKHGFGIADVTKPLDTATP